MDNLLPFEKLKREVLTKREAETNPEYGCKPEERSAEELISCGIINLDKPSGPSSHQVSAYVKQILGISKTGHSGTLDPKVTGVLPVALGRATRIAEVLLTAGKEYICLMQLHKDLEEATIRKACNEFVGKIKQLPPVKSSVVRKIRERNIYYLDIIEITGRAVLFRVGCQAGTYIRKLVSDIGGKIGGAHMTELRRTKAGPFREQDSFTLQDITDAYHYYKKEGNDKYLRKAIQPIEKAVESITNLIDNGDKLYIITARPAKFNKKTGDWIKYHLKTDKIEIIHAGDFHKGQGANKAQICKELGIKIILEDSGETALECAKEGIQVILFDKPWNKNYNYKNITRVNDWSQAINLLKNYSKT